jgi:hypothetical protein
VSASSPGGEHFVKTSEIRAAVGGREVDVLDQLGIPWRRGKPHIDCPYPDHGGADDWRWDGRKSRAFCTCIGRRPHERQSHSIFDVVALVEAIDFEAAKIRVAQIIRRPDLIKTQGDGERHQATDPESLLKPRPNNRNDDLPWIYLGYRLGVDPNRLPRPRTRVAGLKALGYFDPPPQGKKTVKPTLVTTTPCAVFEQVDRDGKIHAHRIYLAEGGLGKADLGLDASGKARDPKKSAKKIEDDNTSGRSVLWGDPATATVAIICEGVETAAAIALAFEAEIEAGEIQVVSCINAAGIENFKPWPQTKEVIVAADRDEAADGGHAPSRRGEHAAREFGIRHHPDFAGEAALPVSIALPGMPGESVDWLDILRGDGAADTAENCPHWTLSGAAGFAGVLIDLMKFDTCGLNQSGDTSIGKTSGQQTAVSAWSSPKQSDGGLLKTMRATENAVEALARDSSGTILALDELAHTDGRVIGRLLYSLAGDVGKSRMRPDGSLRRPHTWSTIALLSGEKSLEQKIRDDGGQWTGGMAARFPDVDVTGVNSRVASETIDALKQIFRHYGHAGPAFVRVLVANGLHLEPDLLKERILAVARTLAARPPPAQRSELQSRSRS